MTRSLSLADDAYEDLKSLKREGESFSDVARRLSKNEKKTLFFSLAGVWKDKKDIDTRLKQIQKDRKTAALRY